MLENIDQTHVVLARGKLVLQKRFNSRGRKEVVLEGSVIGKLARAFGSSLHDDNCFFSRKIFSGSHGLNPPPPDKYA